MLDTSGTPEKELEIIMSIKKIMAVILACVAVAAFSACKETTPVDNSGDVNNDVNNEVVNNTETDGEEEIDYLSDLSKEKYDGYDFRILMRKTQVAQQVPTEDSEDLVESATYRRNKLVEEMYGITISGFESSNNNYETDALNSILAGDDAYDLIFAHSRAAFAYAVNGAAYNFNDISTIHLDKPWWSQDITESCNINGNLYVIDGDISPQSLGATMCMFFNKRIFDELGFDYPYESVLNGEWTFEEFSYLAKKGGKDLNGNGVMEPAFDQYGFRGEEWESPIAILYTGGQKIYDKNEEGKIYLSLYSNKTVDIFDSFFRLTNSDACYLITKNKRDPAAWDLFVNGRAMFTDTELRHAQTMRDMDDDFGILPYPKFDEDDVYATVPNGGTALIVIPITVSDVERTGAITEALCAIGSREVIPAFYEKSLKTKYSRDEESEAMIDIIKDSRIYDIGYVAGGTFQSCGYDIAQRENQDFSSYYASKETQALVNVEKFNSDYGNFEE